ncbi:unnamed protein product [Schistosoma curassoni]|uniref:DUF6451 domain-containing protein n=1 Tax=Schistosoma curassoni TaxID=6186 RepID=A0A183JX75_9TREM|nr:unnamed protein product [Schistosoma curassoni]
MGGTANRHIPMVDWIMKTSTSEWKHGIQWTARNQLEDLDFADDLSLLSHTCDQMQVKTTSVVEASASFGLNTHKGKAEVLKCNTENTKPITFDGEVLGELETSTYLNSIINEQGGPDADVNARIGKARIAFAQLKNMWNSKQLSINIKVRIFNSNVETVLPYGAETWRTTTTIIKNLQITSATDYCVRVQPSCHLKRKLGKDAGNYIDFDAVIFELPKILVRYLFFDETFVHSGLTLKSDGKKSIVTVTDVTTELVA